MGYSKPKIIPEDADLSKAAEVLNAGKKVAILVGAGARGTAPQLIEMATLLGAGIAKALLGKDVFAGRPAVRYRRDRPTRDRAKLGIYPRLRYAPDGRHGLSWVKFLPKDGAARAVQIDIKASMCRCGIRSTSAFTAMPPQRLRRSCP